MRRIILVGMLSLGALCAGPIEAAVACPFCPPSISLGQQLEQYDAVVIVRWVAGTQGDGGAAGATIYEVVEILRDVDAPADGSRPDESALPAPAAVSPVTGEPLAAREPAVAPRPSDHTDPQPVKRLKVGERITVAQFHPGEEDARYLLLGSRTVTRINWDPALEISPLARTYLIEAPPRSAPIGERLRYYLRYLESEDEQVAGDAFAEFAGAPYEDVAALAKDFDRVKIRGWIENSDTQATRTGLYGLMLGLCGNADDAKAMEEKIVLDTQDFRLGIDGLIFGYILLTGERGLATVEQAKLTRPDVASSEAYSVLQAVQTIWVYAGDRISKPRLRETMRLFLARPDTAALAIPTLARWQDWSVQDRLRTLFGQPDFDDPSTKRAIVRYLKAAAKAPTPGEGDPPADKEGARRHLEALRQLDPKTVEAAEQSLFD